MQVDRIIKRVKSGTYSEDERPEIPKQLQVEAEPPKPKKLSLVINIKIQVLRALDLLGVAATPEQIQIEYKGLSGNSYDIRVTVRSLHKFTLLKLIKDKSSSRAFMQVKSEWLEDGRLSDKHNK